MNGPATRRKRASLAMAKRLTEVRDKAARAEERAAAAVRSAEASRSILAKEVARLNRLSREDADIGARGNSTVILTGVYRGRAYVQFYDVDQSEFTHLVEMYRDRRDGRDPTLRHIDAPYPLRGSFEI